MSKEVSPQPSRASIGPHTYSSNLGAKGRTVVPQAVREALQVQEGDALLYLETPGGFQLTTRSALIEQLTGTFAREDGLDLTQSLLDDRRTEAQQEQAAE